MHIRLHRHIFILLAIIVVAFALRFYKLGDIPAGLHRDEAFLGYNAFSILKTGKDMSGVFLPLHLHSFLNSPAGYAYLSTPFIALFGLTAFSVRLPAALFGSLTILITYFLAQELFKSYRVSLIASFLLAILPWHITLSRTATENTVVTFFLLLGTLLFLVWQRNNRLVLLVGSFLSFACTILLYQAPRVFVPMLLPFIYFLYHAKIKRHTKLLGLLYSVLIVLPLLLVLLSPSLSLRLRTVGIAASGQTQLQIAESIREDGVSHIGAFMSRMFHNKAIGFADQFLENYFSHFSYDFLFTDKGLPDRYRVPGAPPVYLILLPFLLTGTYWLVTKKDRGATLLLGWMLLVPIGSALAFDDVPNLQRTLMITPILAIAGGIGIMEFSMTVKKYVKRKVSQLLIMGCVGSLLLLSVLWYLHAYYIHGPIHRPWYRQEGYEELVRTVTPLMPSYGKAVVTTRESAPTIFFLFFTKYDPQTFQEETRTGGGGDLDRIAFDGYEFSTEECPVRLVPDKTTVKLMRTGEPGVLYVNYGTCPTPQGIQELAIIRRNDSTVIFRVVAVSP